MTTDLTDEVLQLRNLRELLQETRTRNIELARKNADLERHNRELRQAVDALLQPAPSELLAKNKAHPSLDKVEHDGT
jgi:hypothetical protein